MLQICKAHIYILQIRKKPYLTVIFFIFVMFEFPNINLSNQSTIHLFIQFILLGVLQFKYEFFFNIKI